MILTAALCPRIQTTARRILNARTQEPKPRSERALDTPAHDMSTVCPHRPRTARREPPPAAAEHARGGELTTGATRRRRHARAHLGGADDDVDEALESNGNRRRRRGRRYRGGAQRRWPDWKRPLQNCKMGSTETRIRCAHTGARGSIRRDGGEFGKAHRRASVTGERRAESGGGGARRGGKKWNPRVSRAPWVRLNRPRRLW